MALPSAQELTPAFLTEILRARGMLKDGSVVTIEPHPDAPGQGLVSSVRRLKITYSAGASPGDRGSLPASIILKLPGENLHPELLQRGAHEVAFFQAVEKLDLDLPVPACYDAASDEGTHRFHLLLEDLSATHFQQPLPVPPSNAHCYKIMEGCARIHAAWWNRFPHSSGLPDADTSQRMTMEKADAINRRLMDTLPAFFDYLGDALLPAQRQIIERITGSGFLNRRAQRLCDLRDVTLVHGDLHTGNLMLPRGGAGEAVRFIDWQGWDINVAAIDLAFLIALHWNPPRRAVLEKPLLEHYHHHLLASGVSRYSFEELWRDYRESVAICCLIPVGQFRRGSPVGVIWFGLQDSLAAFSDLRCEEVL